MFQFIKKIFCCFSPHSNAAEGGHEPLLQKPLSSNAQQSAPIQNGSSSESPATHPIDIVSRSSSERPPAPRGSTILEQGGSPEPSEHSGSYSSALDLLGGSTTRTHSQGSSSYRTQDTSGSSANGYNLLRTPSRGMSNSQYTPSNGSSPHPVSRPRTASIDEIARGPFSHSF